MEISDYVTSVLESRQDHTLNVGTGTVEGYSYNLGLDNIRQLWHCSTV